MEHIKVIIVHLVFVVEVFGIILIIAGMAYAFVRYILAAQDSDQRSFKCLRDEVGKALLLGLEVLVAGDVIETVLIEPTLNRVAALALVVIIRTILSLSIEFEISGELPWKKLPSEQEV